jgi:hypothetical protein
MLNRYAFIDALRGYAVLGVISVHVALRGEGGAARQIAQD